MVAADARYFKSNWKWQLTIFGILVVLVTLIYSYYIISKLEQEEYLKAEQFATTLWTISQMEKEQENPDWQSEHECDLTLITKILQGNNTIPVVVLSGDGTVEQYRNIGDNQKEQMDKVEVRKIVDNMIAHGADTIPIVSPYYPTKYLVFSDSNTLRLLQFYPWVQFGLIACFIAFGYFALSAARRFEQNQIWVGLAKETAHQLGTPISAIMGWIENLEQMNEENEENLYMLMELRNDVTRLELIADRFSKIGAHPELHPVNVIEQLDNCRHYMQLRSPKRVEYHFPDPFSVPAIQVPLNAHLFDWVIENLLRNAIDAMETGAGTITARVIELDKFVDIEVQDTGKGIPANAFKTVFKAGYSTKKRGWGLGLSLSKRIIEEYHHGQIMVKESELGKGTTFLIRLNK